MSASRSHSKRVNATLPDKLRQIRESCYEVRPLQHSSLGLTLFEGSCWLRKRSGKLSSTTGSFARAEENSMVDSLQVASRHVGKLPMHVFLRKKGLELRPIAEEYGESALAFSLSPVTIVAVNESNSLAACSNSGVRVSVRCLWRTSPAIRCEPEDIELFLESQREADIFVRCTKAALEDLCHTCMAYALTPNMTEHIEAATAVPSTVGAMLVTEYMLYSLYSGPTNYASGAGSDDSLSSTLAVVFTELCTPAVLSACSNNASGVRCHSLRIYVDQFRTDCLAAITIGVGTEIVYIEGHCSFIVQERLSHILVVGSSQKAAQYVELLRLLCSIDPMDDRALDRASATLLAKASDVKAESIFDHEGGGCSTVLLQHASRSPFLPARLRHSEPTLLTSSPQNRSKSKQAESFDVAAALLNCASARAKPSDTCIVEMTYEEDDDGTSNAMELNGRLHDDCKDTSSDVSDVANDELSNSVKTDCGVGYSHLAGQPPSHS